jgi:hypothetical protein
MYETIHHALLISQPSHNLICPAQNATHAHRTQVALLSTMPLPITARKATSSDIPALLTLILTSFRQIPMFQALQSPLVTRKSFAHDTLWFWRRRFLLDLLDNESEIEVVEVDNVSVRQFGGQQSEGGQGPPCAQGEDAENEDWQEGRNWWFWCREHARLLGQVSSTDREKVIVGFASWKIRMGTHRTSSSPPEKCRTRMVLWLEWLRGKYVVSVRPLGHFSGRRLYAWSVV